MTFERELAIQTGMEYAARKFDEELDDRGCLPIASVHITAVRWGHGAKFWVAESPDFPANLESGFAEILCRLAGRLERGEETK